jgi:serine/threonine-protein kinase
MTDIERQHLEAPPPRPSQGAPVSPAFDAVVLRCMEKTAERRYQSVKAFLEALREAVGAKIDKPEITARAAAIFVEIRVAEGADAESDAVLDDTSAILDATEQSLRGAGLGLPLQTGSAIIGARVLADEPGAADAARDEVVAVAQALADELAARPTAVAEVHVNITVHVGPASVKDSAEAPDGKEIVGGEILATADWAPQENVAGVHLTAAVSN